jgi:cation-transporting ATPase E
VVESEVEVDESLVTGESEPVVRRPGDPLLSGGVCVSGKATMRVSHAGSESYASRLTTEARATRTERTPLQLDIERLIYTTAGLVAAVSAIVAVAALGRHPDTAQVVLAAAVLVALVPQGLAIMSTVSYARGALRISRAGRRPTYQRGRVDQPIDTLSSTRPARSRARISRSRRFG